MKYRCLIVDDEPLACEIIESFLARFDDFIIEATAHNALEALQILKNKRIDLLFLDIQMPKITGIEFLKTLKKRPEVIITTAYRDYAIEGFELEVMDYLLKPISFERFMVSINRFYRIKSTGKDMQITKTDEKTDSGYFYVKENKRMVKIELNKLLYIESLKDYIKIHTTGKLVITKMPISNIEAKLNENQFLRIHRSFVVNISKIEAFSSFNVTVAKNDLPIGRSYKSKVAAVLNPKGIN